MDFFEKTVKGIKSLRIQGATNVAKYAINAFKWEAEKINAKSKMEFLGKLEHFKQILFETRPTEPLMRNALGFMIQKLRNSNAKNPKECKQVIKKAAETFISEIETANQKIVEIGSKMIKTNSTIMTHCHSSTVTAILKKAWKSGKRFNVICTETRPLFQGRITAAELTKAKIPTTMIVDSAMSTYADKADLVLVGADVITAEGALVNKIGTLNLAIVCKRANTTMYSAATLSKFDPETLYGKRASIELRPIQEIWDKPPKGLKIQNPCFDLTPRNLVNAYITENGIFTPESILDEIRTKKNWIITSSRN